MSLTSCLQSPTVSSEEETISKRPQSIHERADGVPHSWGKVFYACWIVAGENWRRVKTELLQLPEMSVSKTPEELLVLAGVDSSREADPAVLDGRENGHDGLAIQREETCDPIGRDTCT